MADYASARIPVEEGDDPGVEPENVTMNEEGNRIQHDSGSGPGEENQEEPGGDEGDLILGKFKTQEDLAKAYQELQAKMSSGESADEGSEGESSESASEGDDDSGEGETPPAESKTLQDAMEAARTAYEENGEVSDEDYARFEDLGVPKEMVDSYLAGQQALAQQSASALMDVAGGSDAFETMSKWAQNGGLDASEIDSFNRTMESGDPGAAKMAMRGLKAAYEAAEGTTPGQRVSGDQNTAQTGVQPFGSVDEMVQAMQDRRYQHDDAYRRKVEQRVHASPF